MMDAKSRLNWTDLVPVGSRVTTVHRNYGLTDAGDLDPRTGYYEDAARHRRLRPAGAPGEVGHRGAVWRVQP